MSSSPCSTIPNVWYRRKARRLLAERRADGVAVGLRQTALAGPRSRGPRSSVGPATAASGSTRRRPNGCSSTPTPTSAPGASACSETSRRVPRALAARLVELAAREPDVTVRAQLACTARRLSPAPGLDVAAAPAARDLDGDDPHLPLLLWWAVEHHALVDLEDTPRPVHIARRPGDRR